MTPPESKPVPPRVWVHFPEQRRQGAAKAYISVDPPSDKTNPNWKPIPYVPESLLSEARREVCDAVLKAARRIYEEEMESNPSDYVWVCKAVAEAREAKSRAGERGEE